MEGLEKSSVVWDETLGEQSQIRRLLQQSVEEMMQAWVKAAMKAIRIMARSWESAGVRK